jgi:hypothetical protein
MLLHPNHAPQPTAAALAILIPMREGNGVKLEKVEAFI